MSGGCWTAGYHLTDKDVKPNDQGYFYQPLSKVVRGKTSIQGQKLTDK